MRRRVGRGMEIRSQTREDTRALSEINHNGRMGDRVIYRSVWADARKVVCAPPRQNILGSQGRFVRLRADEGGWRADP